MPSTGPTSLALSKTGNLTARLVGHSRKNSGDANRNCGRISAPVLKAPMNLSDLTRFLVVHMLAIWECFANPMVNGLLAHWKCNNICWRRTFQIVGLIAVPYRPPTMRSHTPRWLPTQSLHTLEEVDDDDDERVYFNMA